MASNVERTLGRIEGVLETIQRQQSTAFKKIDDVKVDMGSVKTDVGGMKAEIKSLQDNHKNHETRLSHLDEDNVDHKVTKGKAVGVFAGLTLAAGAVAFAAEMAWKALTRG